MDTTGEKVKNVLQKVVQELILPEFEIIKGENREIKITLQLTNKRLDDINLQLQDKSRRIDETNKRIDEINKRIDETNKRMDELRTELRYEMSELRLQIVQTNKRIDKLYEVIVRREEHDKLESRVIQLEHDIAQLREEIQQKLALYPNLQSSISTSG